MNNLAKSLKMSTNFAVCGIFLTSLTSCGHASRGGTSTLKLVNGTLLDAATAPAAIRISLPLPASEGAGVSASCTAEWVSHNTVMTAAHCVTDNGATLTQATITDGLGKGLTTTLIYPNANYVDASASFDVALIRFPDHSIDESLAAKLSSLRPAVAQSISIVGYGNFNHVEQSGSGQRRGGKNSITEIGETIDFTGSATPKSSSGTGDDVLNSQGDSGGPMYLGGLADQNLIGVSSTVNSEADAAGRYSGHYTNLFFAKNFDWLQGMAKSGQARIVGIN